MSSPSMIKQIRFLSAWLNTRSTRLDGNLSMTVAVIDRTTKRGMGESLESAVAPLLAKGFIRKVPSPKEQRYAITKKGVAALNRHSNTVNRMIDGTL